MAKISITETTIADYMKRNKCSREEAIDLIKYDNDVEGGEATEYDLTEEQQNFVSTLMRRTEHKTKSRKAPARKPNELKEAIVSEFAEFLREDAQGQLYEDVEITNPNRMLHFSVGDKEFDLMLVEKRAKK